MKHNGGKNFSNYLVPVCDIKLSTNDVHKNIKNIFKLLYA